MKRLVEVIEYDEKWKEDYTLLKLELLKVLPNEIINIFHIGSTSLKGMAAKPIIDIMLEVKSINEIDQKESLLKQSKWEAFGEYGIKNRRYFIKRLGQKHLVHLHCFEYGHKAIKQHLFFKYYLSEHIEDFNEYKELKLKNALQYKEDIESYQAAKHDFINKIDFKAQELYKSFVPKMRNTNKLISYNKCLEIIKNKANYGTLTITADIPYSVPLNYVLIDNTLYFHTGKNGYKLLGLNKLASFNIINDLGLNLKQRTHNFESVIIYGKLFEETENKSIILQSFLNKFALEIQESNIHIDDSNVKIIGLNLSYMIGKYNIYK